MSSTTRAMVPPVLLATTGGYENGPSPRDDAGSVGDTGPRADAPIDPRVDARADSSDAGPCVPASCEASCGALPDGCGATLDCGPCPAGRARSVTQYGITWTFDTEHDVGQFINGDWWVVGPVEIVSVSPEPTGVRNGSMINPLGTQAYDDRGGPFDPDAVVTFPRVLAPNDSLVSSISNPEEPTCAMGSTPAWRRFDGGCERGVLQTQAILSVVAEAMPPDAFRPPYSGDSKPLRRVADVCWSALPSLAPPEDLSDVEDLLRHIERPWVDHVGGHWHRESCATDNWLCYGGEVGRIVSEIAAYVVLDAPRQRDLAIRLIQLGIDLHAVYAAGGAFPSGGGHFNGYKFPMVFAGLLLGDAEMASPGTDIGGEDSMTYYAPDGTARWGSDCESCFVENGCSYGGSCTAGPKDCRDPSGETDGCGEYRSCCTSVTWPGEALAIRLMGGREAWGHDAFFDYVDRWMSGDVEDSTGASGLAGLVWELHRDAPPPAIVRCE